MVYNLVLYEFERHEVQSNVHKTFCVTREMGKWFSPLQDVSAKRSIALPSYQVISPVPVSSSSPPLLPLLPLSFLSFSHLLPSSPSPPLLLLPPPPPLLCTPSSFPSTSFLHFFTPPPSSFLPPLSATMTP